MAAAPQIRGAPPKQGVPSPLLIFCLLLLLPGSRCQVTSHSVAPPARDAPDIPSVGTSPTPARSCRSSGAVRVRPGPPSCSGALGDNVSVECRFEAPSDATVTWLQLQHNHSGLYFCRVQSGRAIAQSCGTFVRVEEPVPAAFLQLNDSTKNRILTAQGVLLLLCAAGPGLLLLFRKRWANERLLQPKKISLEEENLYEGLNLDECSMYEDISRGVQPTYQDVGTPPAADGLLEKP